MLPAIALGQERGEGDVMKRPPRAREEKLLTPPLLLTAYGIKGPIEALACFFCYFAVLFASKTRFQSVFTEGLFSNRMVLLGIATELIILALIIWNPFANLIFNTSPLDLRYILLSIPFAIFLLGIDELRKYLLRRNVDWAIRFLKW
jgi:sodium/potassium-transporting ATPase subunit alpha